MIKLTLKNNKRINKIIFNNFRYLLFLILFKIIDKFKFINNSFNFE